MQIGEVAERTGLSLRTIRYYEEVGLIGPSARSQGGFRLYTDSDVDRLVVIKRMKPLDLTLEQTRELLGVFDLMAVRPAAGTPERATLRETLSRYESAARARAERLLAQLDTVREFTAHLGDYLSTLDDAEKLPGHCGATEPPQTVLAAPPAITTSLPSR